MGLRKSFIFRVVCFAILFVSFAQTHVEAQKLILFDSIYQPQNGYVGNANFHYNIAKDGTRIKNGAFRFTSKSIDSTCDFTVRRISWSGNYKNNKKVNSWDFQDRSDEVSLLDVDENYAVKQILKTQSKNISAKYQNGIPQGLWKLSAEELVNGKLKEVYHSFEASLVKTKFEGKILINGIDKNHKIFSVVGQVNAGLMEGKWEFMYSEQSVPIKEIRLYEKGFLISLEKINEQSGDRILRIDFPLSKKINDFLQNKNSVNHSANTPLSLTYSDGYPRTTELVKEQEFGNNLIRNALNDLFQFEPDFINEYGLPIGTNRMIYPLSTEEKKALKELPETIISYKNRVVEFDNLFQTNMNSTANPSLDLIHVWIQKQLALIEYTKPWNQIFALNEIQFYNREGRLFDYAKDLLTADSLPLSNGMNLIHYSTEDADSNFLSYVLTNFKKRIQFSDSLYKDYDLIMEDIRLEASIFKLEEEIITLKHSLDSLYGIGSNYSEKQTDLRSQIAKNFLYDSFLQRNKEFVLFEGSLETHKKMGDSLLHELLLLKQIDTRIKTVFINIHNLDSIYTEYVFNPYTFNDKVPVRKKEKIYQLVAEDVVNELVREMESEVEIDLLLQKITKLENIQEQLFFLVDKDTNKIERKLKKKMSTDKKMEVFYSINR